MARPRRRLGRTPGLEPLILDFFTHTAALGQITYCGEENLAIAVDTGRGLLSPVLFNAGMTTWLAR